MLLKKTGINMKQLTNWFTNARKRIWKPMMRREHSRQLQNAMEYDKTRPREAFNIVPGHGPPNAAYVSIWLTLAGNVDGWLTHSDLLFITL